MPRKPKAVAVEAIKLPPHCTTTVAPELHAGLLAGGSIVDASEVESVGQAVLQLLAAARASVGQRFTITDPSPAFVDRITACGLAQTIGLIIEEEPVQ